MRERHEHSTARLNNTRELSERLRVASFLDVLENRDREGVVECSVVKRQRAPVCDAEFEAGDVPGERRPGLDLTLQLVDGRNADSLRASTTERSFGPARSRTRSPGFASNCSSAQGNSR